MRLTVPPCGPPRKGCAELTISRYSYLHSLYTDYQIMNNHYPVTILYCSLKCNKHSAIMSLAHMSSRMRESASGKRPGTVERDSCWFCRYLSGNVVQIEVQQRPIPEWSVSTNVCNIFTMPENIFHSMLESSPESSFQARPASVHQTQTRDETRLPPSTIYHPASM